MLVTILLLIVGFAVLVKGADWLVDGASSMARRYRVSELVIGLTVIAFGTSAPELVVNIVASLKKYNDLTVGNIVGSNIFNLLCILGISGLIYPITIQNKTVWREIPFSLLAGLLLLLLANTSFHHQSVKMLSRWDGIIFLIFFVLFSVYIFINLKDNKQDQDGNIKVFSLWLTLLYVVIGFAALVIGSKLVINNSIKIAHAFGVSEKLIGLTIVSVGTSLPELVTSAVAAFKKRSDIAIGNIIGSNIFNIYLILGVSAVIDPIRYNTSFNTDIFVYLGATLLLFIAMFSGGKKKLDRWEAAIMLGAYLVYLVYIINRR
jgi:cation:H+ antiporter